MVMSACKQAQWLIFMTLVCGVMFLCYRPGGTGNSNKTKLMCKEKCLMRMNLNSQLGFQNVGEGRREVECQRNETSKTKQSLYSFLINKQKTLSSQKKRVFKTTVIMVNEWHCSSTTLVYLVFRVPHHTFFKTNKNQVCQTICHVKAKCKNESETLQQAPFYWASSHVIGHGRN